VYYSNFVKISDCLKYLLYNTCSFFLSKDSLFKYFIKKFATFAQLCNYIISFIICKYFIQFQNIWVIKFTQNGNFIFKRLFFLSCHYIFSYKFHCSYDLSIPINAFSHFTESSLSKYLAYLIAITEFTVVVSDEVSLVNGKIACLGDRRISLWCLDLLHRYFRCFILFALTRSHYSYFIIKLKVFIP